MGKDNFAGRKHERIQVSKRTEQTGPPMRSAWPAFNGDGYALHLDFRPCSGCKFHADCKKFRPARPGL